MPQTPQETFAGRLRDARATRRWKQQDLADAMRALDQPIDRATIAKIERGTRPVRIDELFAFAAALDMSPLFLVLPLDPDELVQLTPTTTASADLISEWAQGARPLDPANEHTYRQQARDPVTARLADLAEAFKAATAGRSFTPHTASLAERRQRAKGDER